MSKRNIFKFLFLLMILFILWTGIGSIFAESGSDAIAVRVIPNPNHYSAKVWYKKQGFTGSPQKINIDGYEGVREGRTAYVGAANVDDKGTVDVGDDEMFTNIYLLSYNQEAEGDTVDIFGELLSHWKFNTNLTKVDTCNKTVSKFCLVDSDCPKGEYCLSRKAKVTRDTRRLGDLSNIHELISIYYTNRGRYPALQAGTYIPGISLSVWSSWVKNLSQELGEILSVDPINKMGNCGDLRFNEITCWDEQAKEFADPDLSNGVLDVPANSNIYVYQTKDSGYSYELCAFMESGLIDPSDGACTSKTSSNSDPVFDKFSMPMAVSGEPFFGFITASDPDGDDLTWEFDLTLLPTWASWAVLPNSPNSLKLDDSSVVGQKQVYGIPGNPGKYSFGVIVSDGNGGSASKTFTIEVIKGCMLPWGEAISHGESVMAFKSAVVSCGSSCEMEMRLCEDGLLSGSYNFESCAIIDTDGDTVSDCDSKGNKLDNCINTKNPDQSDVDSDGIGDICDTCYQYKESCVELKISQGAWSEVFYPYFSMESGPEFYCYDGACDACKDSDPSTPCTTYVASSNVVEYDIVKNGRSNLFGYIDVGSNILSLGIIHDAPEDGSGGMVKWDLSGTGWVMGSISAYDDSPGEFGDWKWFECCTDGGMIEVADLDTGWKINITPNLWDGISSWMAKNPGDIENGEYVPDINSPITIEYCPGGCNEPLASCVLPWGGSIPHGDSVKAYEEPLVPCLGFCNSEMRLCDNGKLLGSYINKNCAYVPCKSCDGSAFGVPWAGTVTHGDFVKAYYVDKVPCDTPCPFEARFCKDGELLGSYTYQNCSEIIVDTDGDGVNDCDDNCPYKPNPNQLDSDGDGWGNVCECGDGIFEPYEECETSVLVSVSKMKELLEAKLPGITVGLSDDDIRRIYEHSCTKDCILGCLTSPNLKDIGLGCYLDTNGVLGIQDNDCQKGRYVCESDVNVECYNTFMDPEYVNDYALSGGGPIFDECCMYLAFNDPINFSSVSVILPGNDYSCIMDGCDGYVDLGNNNPNYLQGPASSLGFQDLSPWTYVYPAGVVRSGFQYNCDEVCKERNRGICVGVGMSNPYDVVSRCTYDNCDSGPTCNSDANLVNTTCKVNFYYWSTHSCWDGAHTFPVKSTACYCLSN